MFKSRSRELDQLVKLSKRYYFFAIGGARVLLHLSPAAMFESSHSSFPTLSPGKRRAVFGFPKKQSWFFTWKA